MSIIRQDIIDAIETRLKTILTTASYHSNAGSNVYVWRTTPLPPESIPALIIKDSLSTKLGEGEAGPYSKDTWELSVDIVGMVTNGNASDTQTRQVMADVYKAIGSDDTWGGKAITTTLESDEIGEVKQQDKTFFGFIMKVKIMYRTNKYAES
jgi:hypothetical protein